MGDGAKAWERRRRRSQPLIRRGLCTFLRNEWPILAPSWIYRTGPDARPGGYGAMNEESLFAMARAMSSATRRQAFLDEECAGDDRLRQRLELLLAANERARGILDHGQDAATILGEYTPEPSLAARQVFHGRF